MLSKKWLIECKIFFMFQILVIGDLYLTPLFLDFSSILALVIFYYFGGSGEKEQNKVQLFHRILHSWRIYIHLK